MPKPTEKSRREAVDKMAKRLKDNNPGLSSEKAHKEAVKIADRVSRHQRDGRGK